MRGPTIQAQHIHARTMAAIFAHRLPRCPSSRPPWRALLATLHDGAAEWVATPRLKAPYLLQGSLEHLLAPLMLVAAPLTLSVARRLIRPLPHLPQAVGLQHAMHESCCEVLVSQARRCLSRLVGSAHPKA